MYVVECVHGELVMRKVKPQSPPRIRKPDTRKELLVPLESYESGVIVFVGGSYHLILDGESIPDDSIIVAVWTGVFWLLLPDIDEIRQWIEQQFATESQREEAFQLLRQKEFHDKLQVEIKNYITDIEKELRTRYSVKCLERYQWDQEKERMEEDARNIMYELLIQHLQSSNMHSQSDMDSEMQEQ